MFLPPALLYVEIMCKIFCVILFLVSSLLFQPAVFAEDNNHFEADIVLEDLPDEIFTQTSFTQDETMFEQRPEPREDLLALTNITILGLYNPLLLKDNQPGVWVRPYASYDKVDIGYGALAELTMYGALIGYDSSLKDLKNDWQAMYAGYAGYRGSNQNYYGLSILSNSLMAGAAATFYKKDFFCFFALDGGGGNAHTDFSQNAATIHAAAAFRLGYNINLKNNITIQPNYIMSYTFADTFNFEDYNHNIYRTGLLNTIQVIPSIRAYANLKNEFKPFLIINMVLPYMASENISINNYALPGVSTYPYIEYGGGFQKKWKNESSGFLQLLIRNGGKMGVSVLLGFKVPIGRK